MTRNCLSCALYRVELHVLQVNIYINSQLRNRFKPLLPWETLPCYNCHLSTCIWAFVMIYPLQTLPLPTFKYSIPTNQTIHFLLVSTRTIRGDKVFFNPAKLLSMHILVTKRKKRVFVILLTLTFGPVFQTIEYRRSLVFTCHQSTVYIHELPVVTGTTTELCAMLCLPFILPCFTLLRARITFTTFNGYDQCKQNL